MHRTGSLACLVIGMAVVAAGCTSSGSSNASGAPVEAATDGPVPLIVDYSPTVSDVGALLYLLSHPDADVLAVTVPVTGEAGCELGVEVTLGILAMFERDDIPVACDPETPPNAGEWPAEFLAGHEALAAGLPAATASVDARPAHQVIADVVAASEEPVRIYAVAPLTNVARALENHPEVAERLDSIVIMGGAIDVPGNVPNATAEWNLWIDVPAAAAVLGSGVPTTLVPLDATNDVPVPPDWSDALATVEQSEAVVYLRGLVETFPAVTSGFFFLWDELAASVAVGVDLVSTEDMGVTVVAEPGSDYGRTVRDPEGSPVTAATAVPDPDQLYTNFLETLSGAPVGLPPPGQPSDAAAESAAAADGEAEAVLASWLAAATAGDLEASTELLANDVVWIGPVGASPEAYIEGSTPYEAYDVDVACGSDERGAMCEVTWNDLWIDAIPDVERGWMQVVARVEDGRIKGFEEWTFAPEVVDAFEDHFVWLETEYADRLAAACGTDSGSKPCSELMVDTVTDWVAATP